MNRGIWVVLFVFLSLGLHAQVTKDTISISIRDLSLDQVLDSVSAKSGYHFIYNAQLLPVGSLYSLERDQIAVDKLISLLLIGSNLEYVKSGDQIVLVRKNQARKGITGAQISGKVTTKEGVPISGVSVFLNGTTIGSASDSSGIYSFHCEPGVYQVVFSHIEYETATVGIRVLPTLEPIQANAELGFRYKVLPDVDIFADPDKLEAERARYLATFEQEFMGTSTFGMRCRIENPAVLYFSNDPFSGILRAFADVPLIVTNEALGYKIEAILEFFEKDDEITRFHVRARFYELEARNKWKSKAWERNRMKAYLGSKSHFLHSFIQNQLKENDFEIYGVKNVDEVRNENYQPLLRDSLLLADRAGEVDIAFDDLILVEYRGEKPDKIFLKNLYDGALKTSDLYAYSMSLQGFKSQRSLILLTEGNLTIEKAGLNYNKFAMDTYGYWSWERVGELLPSNYKMEREK